MEKIINKYETIFIIDASLEEEAINNLVEKFTTLKGNAGTVESVDSWGKRRLAYEINDKTEGVYTLVNFSSEPDFIKELDRIYNITDGILRTITVRK